MSETVSETSGTYTAPDTTTIAARLVALCKAGENLRAIGELYADDIVSWEKDEPMREVRGKPGVIGKLHWWEGAHEVHAASVEGPYVNGDQFAVRFRYDVTFKDTGRRFEMDEIAVYRVGGGRIVEERFHY